MSTAQLPAAGQVIKTRLGTKTWRVLRTLNEELYLEGISNLKFKRLSIEQYCKTWELA